ncbi:MAG: hypothetical protein ACRCXZ_06595 [Patescibacteria group bacterium]
MNNQLSFFERFSQFLSFKQELIDRCIELFGDSVKFEYGHEGSYNSGYEPNKISAKEFWINFVERSLQSDSGVNPNLLIFFIDRHQWIVENAKSFVFLKSIGMDTSCCFEESVSYHICLRLGKNSSFFRQLDFKCDLKDEDSISKSQFILDLTTDDPWPINAEDYRYPEHINNILREFNYILVN